MADRHRALHKCDSLFAVENLQAKLGYLYVSCSNAWDGSHMQSQGCHWPNRSYTHIVQEPRHVRGSYAAGGGGDGASEDAAGKAFVSVNWVLSEAPLLLEEELAWGFLDQLMLGTSAAPLRKALNDSGLGEALIGGGLGDELRQPVFSLGLKGVDPANTAKVQSLEILPAWPGHDCVLCWKSCRGIRGK